MDINKISEHVINVLKNRRELMFFVVVLVFFLVFFAFFFGLFTIPLLKGVIGFYRMEPLSSFDYFYILFSSIVSALIFTLTFYHIKSKKQTVKETARTAFGKGSTVSFLGITTGIFGAICPACLGINFLLLGNVFTAQLSFLIPYIFWIQLGGIILLLFGLYLVAKSSYEKKCISCDITDKVNSTDNGQIFTKILAVFVGAVLVFQISSSFMEDRVNISSYNNSLIINSKLLDVDAIIEEVTPQDGFVTNVRWGNIVSKMVNEGALDPQKLENILTKRYGQEMKPQWREVLAGKDAYLEISNDNAVFMMYLLWVLAKHNDNQILLESSLSKYFTNYDIGVGKVGYGDMELLSLTPAQQKVAKEVTENAYRPCCGNSTARPDCSHGFSALGLVQLMASQDFNKEEIFDVFVKFNSFWFPETYIKSAIYFKVIEEKNWNEVDKELISGVEYSSLKGSYKVKNYLKENFGI